MRLLECLNGLGVYVCMHVCVCVLLFFFSAPTPANLCTARWENHIHGNKLHCSPI